MRFEVLGPLRVRENGSAVDIGGPRQQSVLASLLASYPDAVSVDQLVDEVWSDDPPDTARHIVRTYVSNLRKVLGERICSDGTRYCLSLEDDELDALDLAGALAVARDSVGDAQRVADTLVAAERLWRGPPLGELADDGPRLRAAAARWSEEHLDAVEARIDAQLRLGQHTRVIAELRDLSTNHPYRERFHGQLMLALYRSGRQVEALRVFAALRSLLGDDLGIEPSEELRDLEERILLQDAGLALEPPHFLPSPVSSFVGRRYEVGEVSKLIDAHRLITLTGPGGVGKSRLAIEVAHLRLAHFPGGVWWMDLSAASSVEAAQKVLATTLGVADQPSASVLDVVTRFLSGRHALLVLDNCEHLLPALAESIAAVLEGAPHAHALATSRVAMHIGGEVRWQVPPLSLPTDDVPGGMSDAERLYLARCAELGVHVDIEDDAVAAAVRSVCADLDGLPLAIELAAGRSAVLSPGELADLLAERHDLSLVRDRAMPRRQRSLRATIDWSYQLLTELQRLVFERLSVFAGPFDLEAVRAVSGYPPLSADGAVDAVGGLAEASLVSRVDDTAANAQLRMLDTIRHFAGDRLSERGEAATATARHARHYLDVLASAGASRLTPQFADWAVRIDAARADIAAALDWSLDHEPRAVTLRAAPGLLEYWFRRGDPAPAYSYGVRMLDGAEGAPPRLRAAAHLCAGFGAVFAGDISRATIGIDTAIDLLEGEDDWRSLCWALLGRGQNAVVLGDLATAAAMGRRILDVCRDHDAHLPRSYGLALLAENEFFSDGDLAVARSYVDEAIDGFRRLRDPASLNVFGLGIAASIAATQGDFAGAESYAEEATTLPGPGWAATAYIILGGWVLHPRGEVDRAKRVLVHGVGLAHEMSMEPWVRNGLLFLARIAADEQRWERAARLFGACRPQPPWGLHPRWWTAEPLVRDAIGAGRYERFIERAAADPLDEVVAWVLEF